VNGKVQPVIIIKRKKSGHAAHHGGAWKVAYADFVTAMMALFIVLWLLSSSEQVKKAVGGYFTDPKGAGKEIGNGLRGAGSESLTLRKDDMSKLKDKLALAVKDSPALQKIKEQVVFTMTSEGLRIEMLEGEKSTFFELGSPQATEFGRDLLGKLADEIGKLPNKVAIEGHTDSKLYGGREYSNWELSTDRANSARRWMQEKGLRMDQVTQVRGYADESPRDAAKPDDPSNRRITVIIQYQAVTAAEIQALSKDAPPPAAEGGAGKPGAAKPEAAKVEPAKPSPVPPAPAKK
jgi:chemotaxis protein MotB